MPLLLIGVFLAGLALNLTPCVFPLIPITVGFFTQQTKDREGSAFPLALAYVIGIALTYSVLGVLDLSHEAQAELGGVDVALVETKIAERLEARASKNWAAADRLRDELLAMGVAIQDGPQGTTWTRVAE